MAVSSTALSSVGEGNFILEIVTVKLLLLLNNYYWAFLKISRAVYDEIVIIIICIYYTATATNIHTNIQNRREQLTFSNFKLLSNWENIATDCICTNNTSKLILQSSQSLCRSVLYYILPSLSAEHRNAAPTGFLQLDFRLTIPHFTNSLTS